MIEGIGDTRRQADWFALNIREDALRAKRYMMSIDRNRAANLLFSHGICARRFSGGRVPFETNSVINTGARYARILMARCR